MKNAIGDILIMLVITAIISAYVLTVDYCYNEIDRKEKKEQTLDSLKKVKLMLEIEKLKTK